jgi:hypothetical protein
MTEGKYTCADIKKLGGKCNDMSSLRITINSADSLHTCDCKFGMKWSKALAKCVRRCGAGKFWFVKSKTDQGCTDNCTSANNQFVVNQDQNACTCPTNTPHWFENRQSCSKCSSKTPFDRYGVCKNGQSCESYKMIANDRTGKCECPAVKKWNANTKKCIDINCPANSWGPDPVTGLCHEIIQCPSKWANTCRGKCYKARTMTVPALTCTPPTTCPDNCLGGAGNIRKKQCGNYQCSACTK